MQVTIDPKDPLGSLQRAGARFDKAETSKSSSFAIQGIEVAGSTSFGTRYTWALPTASLLQAVFQPEKLGKKIVKIFKKELQVGDDLFDKTVYIDTNNQDRTASFLSKDEVRDWVFNVIAAGGTIAVDGTKVVYEMPESDTPSEEMEVEMAQFIAAAIGFGG